MNIFYEKGSFWLIEKIPVQACIMNCRRKIFAQTFDWNSSRLNWSLNWNWTLPNRRIRAICRRLAPVLWRLLDLLNRINFSVNWGVNNKKDRKLLWDALLFDEPFDQFMAGYAIVHFFKLVYTLGLKLYAVGSVVDLHP